MKNFIIKYRSLTPETVNGIRTDDPLKSVSIEASSPFMAAHNFRRGRTDVNYIVSVTAA